MKWQKSGREKHDTNEEGSRGKKLKKGNSGQLCSILRRDSSRTCSVSRTKQQTIAGNKS